jgi:modulator of FtsH protease HflC
MNKRLAILGIVIVVLGILASASLFTVNETQQALVLQFGEPRRVIQEPGLKAKIPFIQNVVIYDRRVLDLDPPVEQVILADQKRLDVDAFARYRITDPLRFFQSVGSEMVLEQRLNTVVVSALRRVLGNVTVLAILSDERSRVMADIRQQVNGEAQRFGIDVVDVRIRRADLPEETSQSIFARMRSEREREAAEFRAQGQEQAQQIRSRAERERTVIIAEAQRDSQVLRGEGDNHAFRIIAEATGRDADFYSFYRTLQAYRDSLRNEDTTMVLSPTGDFFKYFGTLSGMASAGGSGSAPSGVPGGAPGRTSGAGTVPSTPQAPPATQGAENVQPGKSAN